MNTLNPDLIQAIQFFAFAIGFVSGLLLISMFARGFKN